jgi:hypothetical protein
MFSSVLKALPYFFRPCDNCGRDETAFFAQDVAIAGYITPRCWRCEGCADDCIRIYRYSYQPAVTKEDALRFVSLEHREAIVSYVHNGATVVLLMPKIALHKTRCFNSMYTPCGNSTCHASVSCDKRFCSIMCASAATQEGAADSEDEMFVEQVRREIVHRVRVSRQREKQQKDAPLVKKRKSMPCRAPCM